MKNLIALFALMLTLTACAAPIGRPRDTRAMTDHDTCTASCNHDHAICGEEPSNNRERLPGLGGALNSGRDCQLGLGSCLDRCKAL